MTEPSFRWLLHTDPEGLDDCIIYMNRRILIDEDKFFEWLKENSHKHKNRKYQKRKQRGISERRPVETQK